MENRSADFDSLWNYDKPAETEAALRAMLELSMESSYRAQLLSQIGRALGLQRRFDEAHNILEEAFELAGDEPTARCRCRLEKGRAFNSAGDKVRAIACFRNALADAERAEAEGSGEGPNGRSPDFYIVDALHMLAIAAPPEEQMVWHERAISRAESSANPKTRNWLGSLTNNLGWTLHDAGRYEEAMAIFEKALRFREEQGVEENIRIAKWTIARVKRSMGRYEDALNEQLALLEGGAGDGYSEEEIAENLLALAREEEARPHFSRAYELLSEDPWLMQNEQPRLERLQSLARTR